MRTVDMLYCRVQARVSTGGSFVFSYDEGEEDANVGPVSKFEEKMAAQAAAAVGDGTPLADAEVTALP